MHIFLSLIAVAAILAPAVPTASASYMLNRREDYAVKQYNSPDWISRMGRDTYIYASPYRSQTHALHPYYRNAYHTRTLPSDPRVTQPEFYRYLSDLYYDGTLGSGLPLYEHPIVPSPTVQCANYRIHRTSPHTPGIVECY
ncbi:hypothetical protein GX553_03175 [Candidatus Peribacteria bacterium]|nr:hypothetical protein [Candidatus Peribacteria bacterium]